MRARTFCTAFLLAGLAGCHGSSGTGASYWTSLPAATPPSYTAGTVTVEASASLDATGGTLTGPAGTLVAGVVLTVPAGAVSAPTTFTLGHDDGGSFQGIDAAELSGLVIAIGTNGQNQFSKPVIVQFPFTDPTKMPVPYYLNDGGGLDLVKPLPLVRSSGMAGFQTWHASNYTWVNKDPSSPNKPVWSGFSPPLDGFAFSNTIDDDYTPGGRCWGIASFAKWYKETQGSGFGSLFKDPIPTATSKAASLAGQEVIATRAHTSVSLNNLLTSGMSQMQAIFTVLDALNRGAIGIMVGLYHGGDRHAVLAVGFSDNQVLVYDSNHPAEWKAIDYAFNGTSLATVSYGDYDQFDVWTLADMPRVEGFDTILRDAQAGFNGENQTKIEITSHHTGDTVGSKDVTLVGKVHSGEVSISDVQVSVSQDDGTTTDLQPIALNPGEEDFSLPVTLGEGKNDIVFVTQGRTLAAARGLQSIPNDLGTGGKDLFDLDCEPPPKSTISITANWTMITGDPNDPDGKTVSSATWSSAFSYQAFPNTMKRIVAGTFPFDACATGTDCTILYGGSNPTVEDSTVYLPVHVKSSEKTWARTSNGFEMVSQSDGEGDVSWAGLTLTVAVEPGTTADNRQYRLLVAAGCQNESWCPAPANAPRVTEQDLDPDTETWSTVDGGPLLIPTDGVLNQQDNNNIDTITPPRIPSGDFETFIVSGTAPQSFALTGTERHTTNEFSRTEDASVSLNLSP